MAGWLLISKRCFREIANFASEIFGATASDTWFYEFETFVGIEKKRPKTEKLRIIFLVYSIKNIKD